MEGANRSGGPAIRVPAIRTTPTPNTRLGGSWLLSGLRRYRIALFVGVKQLFLSGFILQVTSKRIVRQTHASVKERGFVSNPIRSVFFNYKASNHFCCYIRCRIYFQGL